jgi:uncharacterized protein (TIGR00661 family)
MRLVYGVFGYGRGHATRALALLPELERRHQLLVIAGGMAYDLIARERPVLRAPSVEYAYRDGAMATLATLRENAPAVSDLVFRGPALRAVADRMREFAPDVAICDVEPWTHRAAALLGVPRISFDHYGVLAHCRPPVQPRDLLRYARDVAVYRLLTGRPERVVVSSFYEAPPRRPDVVRVGALLREDVHALRATRGEHLLVYFNQPAMFGDHIAAVLDAAGVPAIVYGTERRGRAGVCEFRAPSQRDFLDDLARCRAVIGSAGNQLVGEALYFGKAMLVMPEDSVEQRINAAAVARAGFGQTLRQGELTTARLRAFLADEPGLRDRTRWCVRDGRAEALAALERFAAELAPLRHRAPALPKVA